MVIPYYIVDAFTDTALKGNPAGVCILDSALDDKLMQDIAAENNLSETAFIQKRDSFYELRWFTPKTEVELCGHATLASAFVVMNYCDRNATGIEFKTKSGMLMSRGTKTDGGSRGTGIGKGRRLRLQEHYLDQRCRAGVT